MMPANTTPARSFTAQTGYKRLTPVAICQDIDTLLSVTEYSFDAGNAEFISYFTSRTGVVLDGNHPEICRRRALGLLMTEVPPLSFYQAIIALDDEAYLSSELITYAYGSKKGQVIPCEERNLRTHRILRGKLQDCWELFQCVQPQAVLPVGQIDMFGGAA